jgi:hypothetical protein
MFRGRGLGLGRRNRLDGRVLGRRWIFRSRRRRRSLRGGRRAFGCRWRRNGNFSARLDQRPRGFASRRVAMNLGFGRFRCRFGRLARQFGRIRLLGLPALGVLRSGSPTFRNCYGRPAAFRDGDDRFVSWLRDWGGWAFARLPGFDRATWISGQIRRQRARRSRLRSVMLAQKTCEGADIPPLRQSPRRFMAGRAIAGEQLSGSLSCRIVSALRERKARQCQQPDNDRPFAQRHVTPPHFADPARPTIIQSASNFLLIPPVTQQRRRNRRAGIRGA